MGLGPSPRRLIKAVVARNDNGGFENKNGSLERYGDNDIEA